jgi:hypothetical protein
LTVPLSPENKRAAEETIWLYNQRRAEPFWICHSNTMRLVLRLGLN